MAILELSDYILTYISFSCNDPMSVSKLYAMTKTVSKLCTSPCAPMKLANLSKGVCEFLILWIFRYLLSIILFIHGTKILNIRTVT